MSIVLHDSSLVSLEAIGKIRDEFYSEINVIEDWIISLYNQTEREAKIKKKRCDICNSKEDPQDLELHHIAGRKHDFKIITVCVSCHRYLSDSQKLWDRRWLLQNQSEKLKECFFLLGLYDILILKSKKTRDLIFERLAEKHIEQISLLLKGENHE